MSRKDAREYLELPLVGLRGGTRHAQHPLKHGLGRGCLRQVAVERLAARSVGARRHHHDDAAVTAHSLRRRHALHRLVHVLVERIAAIRCHHDVRDRHAHAADVLQPRAPRLVRLPEMPCHRMHYLLLAVDHHVRHERELRRLRRVQHVAVDRVPFKDSGPRIRALDELAAVVGEHRLARDYARKHALPPSREARKEVRLDEAFGDEQVCLHRETVHDEPAARRKRASLYEACRVGRVVHHDPLARHDILAELSDQLLARRQPMEASRDQNRDLRRRVPLPDALKQLRHDDLRRDRPSVVARDYHDLPLAGGQFLKTRRANRRV